MTDPTSSANSSIAACTLADGDYLVGAGALANSLYASGFRGVLWVGYRGSLPAWAANATSGDVYAELPVADGFAVRFVAMPGTDTLAIAKPDFALRVLDQLAPHSAGVMFFDADIVALGSWSFYRSWMAAGVGLCTELQPFKHANHPHRLYWRGMIEAVGRRARDLDWYFNSGFVSVPRQHRDLLVAWSQLMQEYRKRVNQPIPGIRHGERLSPLWATDQEMLNAAAMACDAPLSIIGPEGMNFVPLSLYMSHAIAAKPWRSAYLRNAARGITPGQADQHFWRFIDAPIAVLPPALVRWRRLSLKIAKGISRVYGRPAP